MFTYIDYILDRITMYRFALYYLVAIILTAMGLSAFGSIPYSIWSILGSTAVLFGVAWVTNVIFARVYDAPTNVESVYITTLILVCIVPPLQSVHDLPFLGWAAVLAMASKYIVAWHNKHIFNPAAVAVALTALWLNQSAIWWIGTPWMVPVIVVGGLLLLRKIHRFNLVFAFFTTSILTVALFTVVGGHSLSTSLDQLLLKTPFFFFAFVMLTEPLTSPPTQLLQILFGGLVGILFAPEVHIASFYFTPELALIAGNIFAYSVSPKIKERLVLVESKAIASDVMEFIFHPLRPFNFQPGQYMEYTLAHHGSDSRGNRRYLTLASSPTEPEVRLGVKFYPNGSTFKQELLNLEPQQTLMTGQLAGDFTLPKDASRRLVFIAGGIGITPFRSMIKYLTDTNDTRPVTLLFMNKAGREIVYKDIFDEAAKKIGTKTVYTLTETMPRGWTGNTGRIDEEMIKEEVPDYLTCLFYISGPQAMVHSMQHVLRELGVKSSQIKKDFFPGLA